MPVTLTFTRTSAAEYVHRQLGDIAVALGWTVLDDSYHDIIDDAILDAGESDILDIGTEREDAQKFRALLKRAGWRAAVPALASRFDLDLDGQKLSRSQMQTMAKAALALAESEAARYGASDSVALVYGIRRPADPYDSALTDAERVWP